MMKMRDLSDVRVGSMGTVWFAFLLTVSINPLVLSSYQSSPMP
jgi:hypothetical protein